MSPTCPCGSTEWDQEMPHCGHSDCLGRWWARYGVPVILALVGFFAVVLTTSDNGYTCAEGWTDQGAGICVNRGN